MFIIDGVKVGSILNDPEEEEPPPEEPAPAKVGKLASPPDKGTQ